MSPIQTDLFDSFIAALTVITILLGVFIALIFYHLRKKRKELKSRNFLDECNSESEKERIAKDLHDDLGSLLTGLQLSFTSLAERDPSNSLLQSSTAQIGDSIHRLRNISLNLYPREKGLSDAVETMVERLNESNRIKINYTPVDTIGHIAKEKARILFRVIQEITTNAIKHSGAATIDIGIASQPNDLIIEIRDNGTGFDFEESLHKKGSSGLNNIKTRLGLLNAILMVESGKGKGTHYFIKIPNKQLIHGND